ncbi:MAG: SDR family NAD(P)-dependent oxidoreductase [Bacteroidales bacterium]|nr:SDR family NAD(P)-dependent oxidoreductase [Bacteroidales bacterium]
MDTPKAYALVTGASRGLGRDIAEELAQRGFPLILTSTNSRIEETAEELRDRYGIPIVTRIADLTNREDVLRLTADLNDHYELFMLVNNAGMGGSRSFSEAPTDYLERIIDLNIMAVTLLTHELLPNLKRQPKAYILNIGSMTAFNPCAYKTVYPASKAFLWSFSLGLREELKGSAVSVSIASPGAMATNDEVTARIQRQGFWGKATLKSTQHIARKCVRQTLKGKRHIIINPLALALSCLVPDSVRVPLLSRIVKREL